jgi:hypothetical protein
MAVSRSVALVSLAATLLLSAPPAGVKSLDGQPVDVFTARGEVKVLLFIRSDCPISKRYAPELARIGQEFAASPVAFWLVFADRTEAADDIRSVIAEYKFPGTPLRDERHALAARAHATIAPEAAVFDRTGHLVYHGRIDDRYVDIGKARPEPQVHDLEDAISATLAGKAVRQAETQAVGCSLADVE